MIAIDTTNPPPNRKKEYDKRLKEMRKKDGEISYYTPESTSSRIMQEMWELQAIGSYTSPRFSKNKNNTDGKEK